MLRAPTLVTAPFRPTFYRHRRRLSLSSVNGPLHPPLNHRTLPDYFASHILPLASDRLSLICRDERPRLYGGPKTLDADRSHLRWSFSELDRHVIALARGLIGMGVKQGDRVGVVMGNNSAYATLQWACARIGAVLVTINPAYRASELVSTCNLVGVSTLVVVPRIRTSAYLSMLASAAPSLRSYAAGSTLRSHEMPELRRILVVNHSEQDFRDVSDSGIKSLVDFREAFSWQESGETHERVNEIERTLQKDDIINLQFTSGTTGAPKAVSLTHHNLLNNGLNIGRCMRVTPSDATFHLFFTALMSPLPRLASHPHTHVPHRTARLVLGNLAFWSHGAAVLYASPVFSPPAIVDALAAPADEAERCTALHGVPTHHLGVLMEAEKRGVKINGLRTGIASGSPVPMELMRRLRRVLGLPDLTIAYGMTETSPVSFQTTPDDPLDKRVETVGRVLPHTSAKLVDPEGNVAPVNTPGELYVAGYLLQKGYWGDEQQTAAATELDQNGTLWMKTGDEGIMDSEGYLQIVGRKKDIIIRGGENLFPVQVENVLTTHPEVSEVAVIAVPDATYGEVVGAWIVRRPAGSLSRQDVRAHVVAAMNPQNAPTWVWFVGEETIESDGQPVVPNELPKTASGKIQKHILRNWSRELAQKGVGCVASAMGSGSPSQAK